MACSCSTNKQVQVKRVSNSTQHYVQASNSTGKTGMRRIIRRSK